MRFGLSWRCSQPQGCDCTNNVQSLSHHCTVHPHTLCLIFTPFSLSLACSLSSIHCTLAHMRACVTCLCPCPCPTHRSHTDTHTGTHTPVQDFRVRGVTVLDFTDCDTARVGVLQTRESELDLIHRVCACVCSFDTHKMKQMNHTNLKRILRNRIHSYTTYTHTRQHT
jgi:hypothetical protein